MKKKKKIKNINRGMLLIGSSLMLSGCTLKPQEQQISETNDMEVQNTFEKETSNQYQGPSTNGIDMSGNEIIETNNNSSRIENVENNKTEIEEKQTAKEEHTNILNKETLIITPILNNEDLFPTSVVEQNTNKQKEKYAKINTNTQMIIVTPTKGIGKQPTKIPTSIVLMYGVETQTPTIKPTKTPTPTLQPTSTIKPTTTPTAKPTKIPTSTIKPTKTPTPTIKPTATPTPTKNPGDIISLYAVQPPNTIEPTPTVKPTVPVPTKDPNPTFTAVYGVQPPNTRIPTPTTIPNPTNAPYPTSTIMYGVEPPNITIRPTNPGGEVTLDYGVEIGERIGVWEEWNSISLDYASAPYYKKNN